MDVRLLGPLRVLDTDGGTIDIPGSRPKALIALLALESPRVVSTDRLFDALWDGDEPPSRSALHVTVSRLRKSVGESIVETHPGGYRLGVPVANIDVERFRRHAQRARQLLTLGHPGPAAEGFRQALAQWQGETLADLRAFEFAEQAARQLEEERVSAVESLMDAELATGNHELVIGDLAGLVTQFPYRERLWGQLMLALYRSNRQAEALRTFREMSDVLGDELGIEPSSDLTDLEERILLHDPTLDDYSEVGPLGEWQGSTELLSFAPGEVIVSEGDQAGTVYWIEEGRVEIYKTTSDADTTVLAELGPGRYFGELASLLGTGRTASVRAVTPVTVSLHSVEGFRGRLGAERAKDQVDPVPTETVRDLIREGQYLHAYDVAADAIERGSGDPEMRYRAVLALARSGATHQARRKYDAFGLGTISPDSVPTRLAQDIAGLAARLDKDLALRATGDARLRWARRSAEGYQRAFEERGSAFLAVNAATMWLVAGERGRADSLARRALGALESAGEPAGDDRYWHAATEAEAALVLGDHGLAAEALSRAGRAAPKDHASRASTMRNMRLLCRLTGVDEAILDPIANPPVVHFCGHRVSAPGTRQRITEADEPRVKQELLKTFESIGAGFGFGSLAAGADILAAEALLESGIPLHVMLPFDRDEFARTSVAPAGDAWVHRFERCLGQAETVGTATTGDHLDDPTLFDFCARISMGDAIIRAEYLQTDAHQVAVWDGTQTGEPAGTAVDVATWAATGRSTTVIPVEPAPHSSDPAVPIRQICGIVVADFAGFSTLSDAQVLSFQEHVMTRLADAMAPYDDAILSRHTWGDGINIVVRDVATAAQCALDLQDAAQEVDFGAIGVHTVRGLRVAAHATPVIAGWDPITAEAAYFGSGFTQTARIEPGTPEGEIYTTHAFAALAMLSHSDTFECQYVGNLPTAKGYGPMPLYALRRRATPG
ncbi:MAG TPA: BTAD domain-containing putative transcriptional regulator [Acidimicrobiia bacterium]|nr:BTAD domain-containing putative transcriptional regulator [Acidimicrobiia bacterium]